MTRSCSREPTAGWAVGSLLQVLVILTSHQPRLRPHDPLNAVLYYTHDVLLPALGWHLSWLLRDIAGLNGATAIAGGLIFVVLAAVVATQPGRCRVFVVTAVATGLVFTAFTSAFAWAGPGMRVTLGAEYGARYSTLPILLLDAALIVAADAYAHRWWPRPKAVAAVVALIAVLAAGWATDFRYAVRRYTGPRSAWAHTVDPWLRSCQHRPAGTVTITFRNWWGKPPRLPVTFNCSSLRR